MLNVDRRLLQFSCQTAAHIGKKNSQHTSSDLSNQLTVLDTNAFENQVFPSLIGLKKRLFPMDFLSPYRHFFIINSAAQRPGRAGGAHIFLFARSK